ncbi:unnamed protein product [Lactuca virosa]|uniref:Uncharacterized protein n=1 Tax=Lactuca virosa TaxID=75947 RepID=A0AAU9NSL9_9ASTR|nr:unnamed protein product [Lactuca virosa]
MELRDDSGMQAVSWNLPLVFFEFSLTPSIRKAKENHNISFFLAISLPPSFTRRQTSVISSRHLSQLVTYGSSSIIAARSPCLPVAEALCTKS